MISHLNRVKENLKKGIYTSEAAVSQGIVLPILNALNWPVFETDIVTPEYSLEGRRVDYALCYPKNRPTIFIEVKKVGLSGGADRQLFEYAFHQGIPIAVLTDGQEWSIYLPAEQGRYDERRLYKIDLLERTAEEASERFIRYLGYHRVCSGQALIDARADYKNVTRAREVESAFPKAWKSLLSDQDSILLDLLADKVEDMCGYRPSLDKCADFLSSNHKLDVITEEQKIRKTPSTNMKAVIAADQESVLHRKSTSDKQVEMVLKVNSEYVAVSSAKDLMCKIFIYLSSKDSGFLERFCSVKHGQTRRYVARSRAELYAGRPDLCELHAFEFRAGWWIGTNYSRNDMRKIISLALEVSGRDLADKVEFKL